ncbi:GNAT family N-acetyltransferase [Nioella aestuarii]|uniref:GNAT family N-acetyltransferase n=1 Tax=Nioella aestuarii TaxID=1662864 RepID=UPI003D7F8B8B
MDAIEIRRLGLEDADNVLSVRDGVFDGPVRPDRLKQKLSAPGQLLIGAFSDGELVGMASGAVVLEPDKEPSFYLDEIGVHEDWRRRGIGLARARCVLTEARAMGCETVWLATEEDNIPARALYARLGGQAQTGVVVYSWD